MTNTFGATRLTLALALTLSLATPAIASNQTHEAWKHTTKALYKQQGLDKLLRTWENKYVSKEVRRGTILGFQLARVLVEKKVMWRWEF